MSVARAQESSDYWDRQWHPTHLFAASASQLQSAAQALLLLCLRSVSLCAASTLPPNKYDAELQRAYRQATEALSPASASAWTPHSESGGVSISTRSMPGNAQATKGVGFISSSPLPIMAMFSDTEHRKDWDSMVESSRTVEAVDRLTAVAFSAFKAPWPVSKREMLVVGRGQREPDGSFLTYATSVAYTALPVRPGYIRATLFYYAVLITAVQSEGKGGGDRCRVSFVACSDPHGALPRVVVNAASVLQPLNIRRVGDLLSSRAELRPAIERLLTDEMEAAGFKIRPAEAAGGQAPEQDAGGEKADEEEESDAAATAASA